MAASDEELINKAFLIGMKLMKSGLDQELVYVRLEKQGIPEEIARKVSAELFHIEHKKVVSESKSANRHKAKISIISAIVLSIISLIILPTGYYFVPVGLFVSGIIYAAFASN